MAAALGMWNQSLSSGQAQGGAKASPMSGATNAASGANSSAASSTSANIGANDFLTLLVTEMKNQDPTANNDPNQYINQLVQVNSLEQLISINQNLSTALGISPAASDKSSASGQAAKATSRLAENPGVRPIAQNPAGAIKGGTTSSAQTTAAGTKIAPGNLSIPEAKPAAQRVAQALGGRTHTG
jgi:flagellar basal-body rod modification protein FlgD